jgi:alkylation response protein AidB-like acyl-CoA dehydrogenase
MVSLFVMAPAPHVNDSRVVLLKPENVEARLLGTEITDPEQWYRLADVAVRVEHRIRPVTAVTSALMDFTWTQEQRVLREQAREVAADAVRRFGRHNDSWINGYSKEFSAELAALGWIGMTWPTEYGGGGRPALDRLIVGEELIAAGAPIAATWFADRQMGPALIAYGRPDQQAEFLPPILAGASTWCIGMSEPNAGSDLASLKTTASRDRDDWVINGQKIWTSFGASADYCYLICRTSSEGPPHAGISEIIVPMDTPGIEVRPIKDMTTNRHFCEVFFTDVRVPGVNLVGVEGSAFKQTMRQLEHERGGIDRLVSNHALFRHAVERADTSDPLVRQEIAALEINYRIGRILVIREVLRQAPPGFSAATKCFCTEHEIRVSEFVGRTLGAEAMLWNQVTQGLAYAPGYTIMGGTSNVMRNILGERVLGLPK